MNELALPDGGVFVVRPMLEADGPAVRSFFESLSERSKRLRFFGAVTESTLKRLSTVDPDSVVLLAFDASTGTLAGGARAIRQPRDRSVADVAVTVADAYQHRGLGTALLRRLRRAALAEGIEHFDGEVLVDNAVARALVSTAGGSFDFTEPGVLAFAIPLRRPAPVTALATAS